MVNRKVRDNATKQEVEKVNELVHAVLRVVVQIEHLNLIPVSPKFVALLDHIQQSPYAPLYRSMVDELEVEA